MALANVRSSPLSNGLSWTCFNIHVSNIASINMSSESAYSQSINSSLRCFFRLVAAVPYASTYSRKRLCSEVETC